MKKTYLIVNLIWILFALGVCLESWRLDVGNFHAPGPGFLPFIAALLLGILAVIDLLQKVREKDSTEKDFLLWGENFKKAGLLTGVLIVYVLLLNFLGFLVGTFLLLLVLFRVIEPLRWRTILLASLITLGAVYLLFDFFLGTRLPKGILGL